MTLVELINNSVVASRVPAVLLSGGLDSTILLHHLSKKCGEKVHTYTMYQPGCEESENERGFAEAVAKEYNTIHKTVPVKDFLLNLAYLQQFMDRPRWNIWPFYCYNQAYKDGCQNAYIAEGFDEHFGGYWYKPEASYQEYWSGVLEWSLPMHRTLTDHFNIKLHVPFLKLPITETLPYYDCNREKQHLRDAYKGIIPEWVRTRRKNPGRIDFCASWDTDFWTLGKKPKTREESYKLINQYATEHWLRSHEE